MKKILLIDGNSIMNRAFYALMNVGMFRAQDGTYTNAVFGFLNIFFKAIEDYNPEYIAVAFDKGKKTIRHQKYKEYKAGRHKTPDELISQMPIIKEIISAMNIPYYEMDDYEADDILGTLAKNLSSDKNKVYILTGDRDYFQLIDDNINIIYPKTTKGRSFQELWNLEKIKEEYSGLTPDDLIEVKALMGDASDNIPGVRGIGEKTAVKLILEYGNIDDLYKAVDEDKDKLTPKQREKVIEDRDNAFLSRKLGKIITDVDFKYKLKDLIKEDWSDKVKEIFIKLNFKSFLEKFDMLEGGNIESENLPKICEDKEKILEKIDEELNNKKDSNKEKTIYIFHQFYDEIDKLDEKGKRIKQEKVGVLERKINNLSFSFEDEKEVYVLKFENENENKNQKENKDKKSSEKTLEEQNVSFFNSEEVLNDDEILKNKNAEDKKETEILKKIFESKSLKKIVFGSKDLIVNLKTKGIKQENIYLDLKLAEYLLDSGINNYEVSNVASKYLNPKLVETFISNKEYGGFILKKISEKIEEKIKEENLEKVLFEIEMPLLKILANMTFLGIKIDKQKIINFGKQLKEEQEELTKKIYELSGEEFNINSGKQLGVILFEKLKLPVIKKTKTGYSTDISVLEKLENEHEIIKNIIKYRGNAKLISTYIEGFLPYVNEKDGRVHGRFHQTIARTGRISSSEPNLQNIPIKTDQGKIFRESFIPKEGYVFVDSDYSQIELRVMAHIADDQKMIEAFNNGEDIHRSTAAHILNKDINEVTSVERSRAKAINFGIIYGISPYGLSEQIKVSVPQAKTYIDEYLNKYEGIKKYMEEIVQKATKEGYVETLFGRKRYIDEIYSSNFNLREFGKRAAMNTPIQGTAADIVKLAMINTSKALKEENIDANILLQIHDEILLEVKKGEEEKAAKVLKREMENIIKLKVPLIAETNIGKNWLMN